MTHGYSYTFPALRGIQAGRQYYVAMCPLRLLPKLFLFDEDELPAELRAQRCLNAARVPDIVSYILSNRKDYAFSAIVASIDGDVVFEPANMPSGVTDAGSIVIPMSARFIVNDGQHRRAAIEVALQEDLTLGDETIAVVFYVDAGLCRSQQLFADLNKHAVRPTKSIGILYDVRDPVARLVRELSNSIACFKGLTELEKTTISNRSTKLFTLSAIHQATTALLNKKEEDLLSPVERDLAFQFWNILCGLIREWDLAARRKVSSAELRREFVHSHAVVLQAIGLAGHALVTQHPNDWHDRLSPLQSVDWSRSNRCWEGRAMIDGRMNKSWRSILLTSAYLKHQLQLDLTPEEITLEQNGGAAEARL